MPPLFFVVAAFLLTLVISRMVRSEREQIGLIKAFGYSDLAVGLYYFIWPSRSPLWVRRQAAGWACWPDAGWSASTCSSSSFPS